eukprot:6221910-Prymnesium_polylepis.1
MLPTRVLRRPHTCFWRFTTPVPLNPVHNFAAHVPGTLFVQPHMDGGREHLWNLEPSLPAWHLCGGDVHGAAAQPEALDGPRLGVGGRGRDAEPRLGVGAHARDRGLVDHVALDQVVERIAQAAAAVGREA